MKGLIRLAPKRCPLLGLDLRLLALKARSGPKHAGPPADGFVLRISVIETKCPADWEVRPPGSGNGHRVGTRLRLRDGKDRRWWRQIWQ